MPPDRPPNARREAGGHTVPETVPIQLQRAVPACAQQCLSTYITELYDCPQNDVSCLCGKYSSQGYSLGELALICLSQNCKQESSRVSSAQYEICSKRPDAVSGTQRSLTLPSTTHISRATAPSRTNVSAASQTAPSRSKPSEPGLRPTSRQHVSTVNASVTVSYPASATATNSNVSGVHGHGTSESASAVSAAAADAPQKSSRPSTHLTGAQAAGVTLGIVGAIAVIVGLVFLLTGLRRRRKKAADQDEKRCYDFVDKAPRYSAALEQSYDYLRTPPQPSETRRVQFMAEKRSSIRHDKDGSDRPYHHHKTQSVDESPQSEQSYSSMRTLSQLLPDRPHLVLQRKSSTKPKPSYANIATPATLFEEDRPPHATSPEMPAWPLKPEIAKTAPSGSDAAAFRPFRESIPRGLPANPKADKYPQLAGPTPFLPSKSLTPSPPKPQRPTLTLQVPKQASRTPALPLPAVATTKPNTERRNRAASRSRSRSSSGSVLNYYYSSGAEAGNGTSRSSSDLHAPATLSLPIIQQRKPSARRQPPPPEEHSSTPSKRSSGGSDTSFESTDPDESTPPSEEAEAEKGLSKALSPIPEQRTPQSPLSTLRYPKIPRSANQAVPRSPVAVAVASQRPSVTPSPLQKQFGSLSGTTLAAKRRGDTAARGLSLNLEAKQKQVQAQQQQESPLKGYGRSTTTMTRGGMSSLDDRGGPTLDLKSPGMPRTGMAALKSPAWTPTLTPERRGGDLYLAVGPGLATPIGGRFRR